MQEVFFLSQDEIVRGGDGALEGVTKATVVLGQTSSRDRLGDGTRRLENQSGATCVKNRAIN